MEKSIVQVVTFWWTCFHSISQHPPAVVTASHSLLALRSVSGWEAPFRVSPTERFRMYSLALVVAYGNTQ